MEFRDLLRALMLYLMVINCDAYGEMSGSPMSKASKTSKVGSGNSSPFAKIVDTKCGMPTLMNGRVSCSQTSTEKRCTGTCRDGYGFAGTSGSVEIVCYSDGTWSPAASFPSCESLAETGTGHGEYPYGTGTSSSKVSSGKTSSKVSGGGSSSPFTSVIDYKCGAHPQLMNGRVSCTTSSTELRCVGTCRIGYGFGGSSHSKELVCYSDGTWIPSATFPACEPICDPPCENSGTCVGSNYCRCPKGYWGRSCESYISICDIHKGRSIGAKCNYTQELMTCMVNCPVGMTFDSTPSSEYFTCDLTGRWNPSRIPTCVLPTENGAGNYGHGSAGDYGHGGSAQSNDIAVKCGSTPKVTNGRVQCTRTATEMRCTGTCRTGYQFRKNQDTKELVCYSDGTWTPSASFPSCKPICDPPCENSGKCMGHNYCRCPTGYWGQICESSISVCNIHEGRNLGAKCNYTNELMTCVVYCPSGMTFDSPPDSVYYCDPAGRWNPSIIPNCVSSNTIPDGGHHHQTPIIVAPESHSGHPNEIEINCGTPPQLLNGHVSCSRTTREMRCTGKCRTGYEFDASSRTEELVCYSDGRWHPDANFPTCKPICDPPCQNGGVCSGHNYCVCPSKFWGPSCEILTSVCNLREHSNAARECNFTNDLMTCTIHCPDGMTFDSYPSSIYHCDTKGRWDPQTVPSCIPVNEEIIATTLPGQYHVTVATASDTLRNGRCTTWEKKFFQTFDGRLYEFEGGCTYLLTKDCIANSFSIYMNMGEECNENYCEVSIVVYLDNEEYTLRNEEGSPSLFLGTHQLSIPMSESNFMVQMVAHNLVVFSNSGFRLLWDGKMKVQIDVDANFYNKTCGLCGRYNGNTGDDFETVDGWNALTVVEFADSWKMDQIGADCHRTLMPKDTCDSLPAAQVKEARSYCEKIKSPEFGSCLHLVDPDPYIEMCVSEYCACHDSRTDCGCTALSAYFKECMRLGGYLENEWRQTDFCYIQCPNGMEYHDCGSDCPATCANPEQECSTNWCLDGCFCPEGMLLGPDNKCYQMEDCPCTYQNKDYLPGGVMWQDCNSCQCGNGHWTCSKEVCLARCSSIGDPHYTTFDGKHYDFMGKCSYYLVSNDDYSIEQENVACDGSISKAAGFSPIEQVLKPSCTKTVTIRAKGSELHLKQDHSMVLNGRELTELPHFSPGMYVYMPSASFIKIVLKNGLSILWDGETRLYIDAPPSLMNTLRGLCGTFSLSQKDDFYTPEKDIEKSVESFANKWKTDDFCDDVSPSSSDSHPCRVQPHLEKQAKDICNKIKSRLFSDCHDLVDPRPYFDNCMYDLCACKDAQIENCFCPTIADYAAICAKKGAVIEWRQYVTECEVTCSPGQVFTQCGSSCRRSCKNIASNTKCAEQCIEGCNCPEGHTLDDDGRCIPESSCPCLYNDREYAANYVDIRDGLECTCQNAKWECRPATAEKLLDRNVTSPCSEEDNLEGTDCVLECPLTCSNYHKPPICETVHCKPGCQCKHGYVYDPKQKKCVHPEHCPCHHNDRSYKDGESMQQDCNFCLCDGGQWKCEKKDCVGICSAWGKTHYKSFDGRMFEFESDCEFTFVKGSLTSGDQFTINIQNKPCGGVDGACYKTVTFLSGSEELILAKDTVLPEPSIETGIIVREIGLFAVVHTDFGVSLYWDRGSRVYVKMQSRWKGRVEGLCGDYNDNEMDDFRSSAGGPVIVRPNMFAESWQVKKYCPPIGAPADTCEEHPHRHPWAVKKCAVLTSELFADCHSEVPVLDFLKACIADTCGCDSGDDCQCTCTAIAAYAQECSIFGKPIKWRSQELCPIQCRECDKYIPCMSVCPKTTCETEFLYKDISVTCKEEMCVEGCEPPLCAHNEIYEDDKEFKCIPQAECNRQPCAVINGKRYHEGERISDPKVALPCQSCYCMKGKLSCVGEPCGSTLTPPPMTKATPPVVTEEAECNYDPFWSDWISSYIPTYVNGGDYEIVADLVATRDTLCPLEYITAIECRTVGSHILSSKSGDIVHCDLAKGLMCENSDQQPTQLCRDYEIRLYCDCEKNVPPVTTPPPFYEYTSPTEPEDESVLIMTPPVMCLSPGWTVWMTGDGGKNDILSLRGKYAFCPETDIINVECREISTKKPSTLFPDVVCDANGFACLKLDKSLCPQIEIRYDCQCEDAACDAQLGMENGNIKNDQITVSSLDLSKAARLNGPQAWSPEILSNNEWIQVELEEINEITGILTQGSPNSKEWVTHYQVMYSIDGYDWKPLQEGGKTVTFVGNEDNESIKRTDFVTPINAKFIKILPKDWIHGISLRFELLGCNRVEHITQPPTIIAPTTPRPECIKTGWTEWFNIDSPDNNMEAEVNINKFGDYELISHLRRLYPFCITPTSIQCQTAYTKIPSHKTGQKVTCDYDVGLKCENSEEKCLDYEIRLYCECGEITTGYTTTLSTTALRKEGCPYGTSGYTEWMSVSDPASELEGDIESMEELRANYEFCKPDHIMSIECRTKDGQADYKNSGQINLKCNPQDGFRCEHSQQINEICLDYEVRFYCLCLEDVISTSPRTTPGASVLPETYSTTIQTQTAGILCDTWTDWINLSPPSYEIEEELVSNIPNFYDKCPRPTNIRCRHAIDKKDYTEYPELLLDPSCTLEGISCDNRENNNMCPDFEIKVYCECGGTTPPLPVVTVPPVCSPGWTEWFDISNPDSGKGDFERIEDLRQRYQFCSADEISDVKCEAVDHPDITFGGDVVDFKTKLGLVTVKCSKEFGLECFNNLQPNNKCLDYKISIHCECNEPPGYTTPPSVTPICDDWTEWIDDDNPMDGVEEELFSSVSNFDQLCPIIDRVECVEANSELPYTAFGVDEYLDEPCTQRGIRCSGKSCHDFKIRAFCKCGGVTTPEVCETGWTEWFNIDDPYSDDGDFELMDGLRRRYQFCNSDQIINVECSTADTKINYHETGDTGVKCNKYIGAACYNSMQTSHTCEDYRIRFECSCGEITPTIKVRTTTSVETTTTTPIETTTTTPIETTPPPVTPICNEWTEWIDNDNPMDGIEEELFSAISNFDQLCPNIEKTECVEANSELPYTAFGMEQYLDEACTQRGIRCRGENCRDLKIRAYCTCGVSPVPTPEVCVTGWTEWFNIDDPDSDDGDFELMDELRGRYQFCNSDQIINVECSTADTKINYHETGDTGVKCNKYIGATCYNSMQTSQNCHDYRIRFECSCEPPYNVAKSTTTTATPPTTPTRTKTTPSTIPTTTGPICPDGYFWDDCAYSCDNMCHSFLTTSQQNGECPEDMNTEYRSCIGGCVTQLCESPQIWRDKQTCVMPVDCTCIYNGDTVLRPGEVVKVDDCESCQCLKNDLICEKIPGCYTIPPTNRTEISTPLPAITVTTLPPITRVEQPDCWTLWLSADTPDGYGDAETFNKLRIRYEFCANPVKIECRVVDTHEHVENTDESVTCDLKNGLQCKNTKEKRCSDYEVRFYCPCENFTSTLPPTTPEVTIPPCKKLIGLIDYLPDENLRASSSLSSINGPQSARLTSNEAWTPAEQNDEQYLEVDLGSIQPVYGVKLSAHATKPEWVKIYRILYSDDGITFKYYTNLGEDTPKNFPGNYNAKIPIRVKFDRPFEARYVRIQPQSWNTKISLRVDILGCAQISTIPTRPTPTVPEETESTTFTSKLTTTSPFYPTTPTQSTVITYTPVTVSQPEPCKKLVGLLDYLPDENLRASSSLTAINGPQSARLTSNEAWTPAEQNDEQYFEVDLGSIQRVYGVKLSAHATKPEWVKIYRILYSDDGITFKYYTNPGEDIPKNFPGNYNAKIPIRVKFDRPFEARYVRIQPQSWNTKISLRVDILGCAQISSIPPRPTPTTTEKLTTMPVPPGPCVQGYTEWINAHKPDAAGEYEQLLDIRNQGYSFCSSEYITAMQCREVGTKTPADSSSNRGVVCDLNLGYYCKNEDQLPGDKCDDYEVRYLCDCPTSPPPFVKSTTRTPTVPEETESTTYTSKLTTTSPFYPTTPTQSTMITYTPVTVTQPEPCKKLVGLLDYLPDENLRASSSLTAINGPQSARLTSNEAWTPAEQNDEQYFEVDLGSIQRVYGVKLSAHATKPEWVKIYRILYSDDGITFKYYTNPGEDIPKNFPGNYNAKIPIRVKFDRPFEARYVRIQPQSWNTKISLRVDLLGCAQLSTISTTPTTTKIITTTPFYQTPTPSTIIIYTPVTVSQPEPCKTLVGLVDDLPDKNLRASSSVNGPQYARLSSDQAWIPKEQNKNQYIEFDLGTSQPVYGTIIKGHATKTSFVKTYNILYSRDGITYAYYTTKPGESTPKVFPGVYKAGIPIRMKFDRPFTARYVRLQPLSWAGEIALRADILGCAEGVPTTTTSPSTVRDCDEPMGFEDDTLHDDQISVSSYLNEFHGPARIRLETAEENKIGAGAWLAGKLDESQFVQIDFREPRTLTGIVTQGRDGDKDQYVTSYIVQYSNDGKTWQTVTNEYGDKEIFQGNRDGETPVTNYFYYNIRTQYLRIVPQSWHNWIAMRVEIRGCYERYNTLTPVILNPTITTTAITTIECNEPMGVDNGELDASQITVSSTLHGSRSDGSRIGLNKIEDEDTGGWLAKYSDGDQYVVFDFLNTVKLSGIITKGRQMHDEWVSEYTVDYSNDGTTWESAYSRNHDKKFKGNTDGNTAVYQYFDKMIHARYLRIHPTNWHNWIAMRVEILGCIEYVAPTSTPSDECIEYGPWINKGQPHISDGDTESIYQIIMESNMCKNPIEIQCRQAVVTHLDYRAAGQRVTCDLIKGLVCRHKDQRQGAPCYDYEARIGCYICPVITTPTLTTPPLGICPEVPEELHKYCPDYCPEGELCDGQKCVSPLHCACFIDGKKFYPGEKIQRSNCEECDCQLDGRSNCAVKTCSPCGKGLISRLDENDCNCKCEPCPEGTILCPTSKICIPEERWCDGKVDCPDDEIDCVTTPYPSTSTTEPIRVTTLPPPPAVKYTTCELYSSFFKTFDDEEFPYDICDHILMQDKIGQKYSVTIHKVCTKNFKNCQKYLLITQDGNVIRLNGDLSVEYKGQRYSGSQQFRALGKTFTDFSLRTVGPSVIFKSKVYDFEVDWNKQEYVKITVPVGEEFWYKINGLCGFYNDDPKDDFEKPDGSRATSIQDFGDSWAIGPLDQCKEEVCVEEIKVKAVTVCNNLISPPLDECNAHVDPSFYLSACVASMCDCLTREEKSAKECECNAYITYVEACKQKAPSVKLNEWRTKLGCAPTCPPGLIWKDCGPSCERYCDNLQEDLSDCEDSSCIAGCYCPDGTVKKRNDTCVPTEKCQDCICDGYGDPHYTTFDRQYYPFQGNCTYILAQDKSSTGDHKFQVQITNDECIEEPHTTCTTAILLLYNGHTAHFRVNHSVTVDGVQLRPSDLPLEYEGIKITATNRPGRIVTFTVEEIFLEVRYYENNYGFQVRLPSEVYFDRTEGLCGNCNFDITDDLTTSEGVITNNTDEFGISWLAKPPEGMEEINNYCVVHEEKICDNTTVIEECKTILGHQFKSCHMLVNPETVIKACEFDVCHSVNPENSLCRALTEYTRACVQVGVCVQNWRTPKLCPMECPDGMYFDQCGPGCTHTCANKNEYTDVNEKCDREPVEGCFCIGNRIIKDEVCVDPIECETCDEEGHGVGDIWQPDACTDCKCTESLVVECVKTQCPSKPICRENEYAMSVPSANGACCDDHYCVPTPIVNCTEIEIPTCKPGEITKPFRGDDDCIHHKCECDITQCPPVREPTLTEKGQEVVVDKSGCCPQKTVVCNKKKCPPSITCPPGEFLEIYNEHKCCPESRCEPPKDQCFFHHEHGTPNENAVPIGDGDALYAPGDSWMDGKCTKCKCEGNSGKNTAVCKEETCEPPNKYITDNYAIDKVEIPGKCCPGYNRIVCLVNGTKYSVGETWPSEDGDNCKKQQCSDSPAGDVVKTVIKTTCKTDCPAGYRYEYPPASSQECCGQCKPFGCVEMGQIYAVGDEWDSQTKKCAQGICVNDSSVGVVTQYKSICPTFPINCPYDKVGRDENDCCDICLVEPPDETCAAVNVNTTETIGIFRKYINNQLCTNSNPVIDFKECIGTCESYSVYSSGKGDFESNCLCCTPDGTETKTVMLDCTDGSETSYSYKQPKGCSCSVCTGVNEDEFNFIAASQK